jgi:hypothetical protein
MTPQSQLKIQTHSENGSWVIIYHDVYIMILDEGFQNT